MPMPFGGDGRTGVAPLLAAGRPAAAPPQGVQAVLNGQVNELGGEGPRERERSEARTGACAPSADPEFTSNRGDVRSPTYSPSTICRSADVGT